MPGDNRSSLAWARIVHVLLGLGILAGAFAVASLLPVRHAEAPPFATPAFQRAWTSEPAAAAKSIDVWGSDPLVWRVEPYAGAPNNRRTVQYFERGRMEIEAGDSEVTLGLLAREMTMGRIDLGQGSVLERQPPEISVDSGELDDLVPTYLTLSRVVGLPARDRSRNAERITDWVLRSGPGAESSSPEVRRFGEYIEATGHNLPDITVELFQQPEFLDGRWIELFGYPISEPYWTYYRRADARLPSLIQVFERRVLIYTPEIEPKRQFTVAYTGRHYSIWRYGTDPQTPSDPTPENAIDPGLTLVEDLSAYVYADEIGVPLDLALSPTGHLLILTSDGQIWRSDSLDPSGPPDGFSIWASGIREPQGMTTRGGAVLVTAADQIWWYRDRGGVGVREDPSTTELMAAPGAGSAVGKPVRNSAGQVFTRIESPGGGYVLREIGSSDPIVNLSDLFDRPGPIAFTGGDLLVAGSSEDGRSGVYQVSAAASANRQGDPLKIATFPRQTTIRALAIADEELWPIRTYGELIIAVDDGEQTSIFAISRGRAIDESEVIELAGGFGRPTAMIVGLDGSIYVADADQRRVIRIVHTG
jgi:hypothetical protein